jgi:hypothetical protein
MKKKTKYGLITAACIVLLFGLLAIAMGQLGSGFGFATNSEVKKEQVIFLPDSNGEEGVRTKEDPLKELKKITAAYNNEKIFSFQSKISAFKNENNVPAEETTMYYERTEGNHYYQLSNMEYIYGNEGLLLVDHQLKVMSFSQNQMQAKQDQNAQLRIIKEYLELEGADAWVSQTSTHKIIVINNPNHPHVQQYVIRYSPETWYVSEIQMFMAIVQDIGADLAETNTESPEKEIKEEEMKEPSETDTDTTTYKLEDFGLEQAVYKVVIKYTNYNTVLTQIPQHTMKHFIQKQNGGYETTEAYQDYELND